MWARSFHIPNEVRIVRDTCEVWAPAYHMLFKALQEGRIHTMGRPADAESPRFDVPWCIS
jgi:hypothetical protein